MLNADVIADALSVSAGRRVAARELRLQTAGSPGMGGLGGVGARLAGNERLGRQLPLDRVAHQVTESGRHNLNEHAKCRRNCRCPERYRRSANSCLRVPSANSRLAGNERLGRQLPLDRVAHQVTGFGPGELSEPAETLRNPWRSERFRRSASSWSRLSPGFSRFAENGRPGRRRRLGSRKNGRL